MDIKQRLQEVIENDGLSNYGADYIVQLCKDALGQLERWEPKPGKIVIQSLELQVESLELQVDGEPIPNLLRRIVREEIDAVADAIAKNLTAITEAAKAEGERQDAAKCLPKEVTTNKFMVGMQAGMTFIGHRKDYMTAEEALNLAAWLVVVSEFASPTRFDIMLEAVSGT